MHENRKFWVTTAIAITALLISIASTVVNEIRYVKNRKIDILCSQLHQKALDAGGKLGIIFKFNVIAATKKNSGISKIEDFKGKQLIYHLGSSYQQ